MEYLLIQVLREDNNDNKSELQRVFRYTSLLIEPRVKMNIRLANDEIFYVEYIRQDLKNKQVVLYEYIDICHRKFWGKRFWTNYMMAKISLGWKKVPKNWKYSDNER